MADILLYGVIGDEFDGLDAKSVVLEISQVTDTLNLRINSPGGFVTEGLAIYGAAMRARAAGVRVTTYIDGIAASMASVIAMVGEAIVMAPNSLAMIHNPSCSAFGVSAKLRSAADQLDLLRDQCVAIYAKQTGLDVPTLRAMLDAETWFTPEEALAQGFCTAIGQPANATACNVTSFGFRHVPASPLISATAMLGKPKGQAPRQPAHLPPLPKEITMPEPIDAATAVANERTRISQIMALSAKHGIPQELTQRLIAGATSLDTAREHMLDFLADRSDRQNIGNMHHNATSLDNPVAYGNAVQDAILAKISGRAADSAAAEFRAMSVVDIARDFLARGGDRSATRLSPDRVIATAMQPRGAGRAQAYGGGYLGADLGGMHTTSDFPDLIGGASEKYLIERYKMQESPLKQLAVKRNLSNFLTHYGVQTSGFGTLDAVNEAGEFKNKSLSTRKEGYKLETYGNIIAVSRQLLINDALGALASIIQVMAAAATEMEAQILAGLINSNPVLMSDGQPWFSAAHKNVASSGDAPGILTLDAGRQAMRSQRDLDGVTLLDAKPKFLLTPTTLETAAEVLIASTTAATMTQIVGGGDTTVTTAANANPFQNKLTPIADPRLTSTTAWYLFTDPALGAAMQYGYLDGHDAPFLDQHDGWRTDGTEYKVRHDFGAGILDARLAYKNPGA